MRIKKYLFLILMICFCSISAISVAQNTIREAAIPTKETRKTNTSRIEEFSEVSGKPLNSPVFIKTCKPQYPKLFKPSQVSFNTKQDFPSLKSLGDTLYGNMIYSDTWQDFGEWEMPYGIYSFTASTETNFVGKYKNLGLNCNSGVCAQGKYYGINPIVLFGKLNGVGYYVVNTETWTLEKSFIKDAANYDDMASNMTYDKTTNTIYALRYNSDLSGLNWAIVDPVTFTFTNLNAWSGNFSVLTLTATPNGVIYGIGANGNLYTFSKTDGSPTLVGSTGVTPAKYTQSAVYNGKTGTLLWAAVTNTGSTLYSVNLSDGAASKVFDFSNNEQFVGLFTKAETAMDGAPAVIENLSLAFDTPGGLTGQITFTLPSLTYSGGALSGNLHVITRIDGLSANEQDLAPGANHSFSVSLSNDNHAISVIVSNAAGSSPSSVINRFAGYDRPKAVGSLNFRVENGISQLSWDAPTVGINEGFVNADSLYYKVIRYPDNIVVADKLKTTSFSETLPTIMARYSYKVIPFNGMSKEGVPTTSIEIVYGNGFIPPYSQKFENNNALEFFNVIDANSDSYKWKLLYNVVAYWPAYSNPKDANDWLIGPALELKKGIKYKLVFSTKALYSPAVESMKVALGTSQTDVSTYTQELWNNAQIDFYEYANQTVEFSVSESGKYYLGFYAYSSGATGKGLYIDDISVDVVGALAAPAKVANLNIVPDANDELKATVDFTAPSSNLNNELITSIDSICIYRNNDLTTPIHSILNPVVGTHISWTDVNVSQVGICTYTVVPYNSFGTGELSSASSFVGVYMAPYSETFDNSSILGVYTLLSLNTAKSDWKYDSGKVRAENWMNPVNNWMISPALKLEPETVYGFSVDYASYGVSAFNLTLGKSASPQDQQVVKEFSLKAQYMLSPVTGLFSTNEEGKYYVGLNLRSDSTNYFMFDVKLDNISITKLASVKSPGAVTDLTLSANKNGEKLVYISFKAPTEGYNGGPLEAISKIEIFRGSEALPSKTFSSPALDEELSWNDNFVPYGFVKYAIRTENQYGQGRTVIDSVYVGPDKPSAVSSLKLKGDSNNQNVTISWQKPLGVHNGYINYSNITYNIYKYEPSTKVFNLIKEGVTDTVCIVEQNATGDMDIFYYAVSSVLDEYESPIAVWHVVLGKPYALPFSESYIEKSISTNPWVIATTNNSAWTVNSGITLGNIVITPQDNDGGMLIFYTEASNGSGFVDVPKVELFKKDVVNNYLRFWAYQGADIATSGNSYVIVKASSDDNDFVPISDTIRLNSGAGWTSYKIRLDDYKTSNFVTIRFFAYVDSYMDLVGIDNISMYYSFAEDLSINNISGPESVEAAKDASYSVNIKNMGYNAVAGSAYTVKLYNGNEVINSKPGVDLAVDETGNIDFTIHPNVTDVGSAWNLIARIEYSQDQVNNNNVSKTLIVSIEASELPTVNDLGATLVDNKILLSWTQPDLGYSNFENEGFETYKAFAIDSIGNWKLVDSDGQYTGWIGGLTYANAGEAQAYMVWNQKSAGAESYGVLAPHSGDQCLISWTASGILASNDSTVVATNDDWLISPEIKGGTQLSFWAAQPSSQNGYEKFEIWTSSTSNNVEAFIKLQEVQLTVINWTYYSFNLPADAKYFAIRHTSTSCFALMIDDIKYIPADAEVAQYNLLGYNLYRNDSKMSNQLLTTMSTADIPTSSGVYTYAVNAVYAEGESDLSNKVTLNYVPTSIEDSAIDKEQILSGKGEVIILGLQGKVIKVFTIDGKQIATFKCTNQRQSHSLPLGVYVVSASNGVVGKIVVY